MAINVKSPFLAIAAYASTIENSVCVAAASGRKTQSTPAPDQLEQHNIVGERVTTLDEMFSSGQKKRFDAQ